MDGVWPWLLFGFVMWLIFSNDDSKGDKGRSACGGRRGRSKRREEANAEILRLREALAESHSQIDALKARLEAVETIITDEDRSLRKAFQDLERAGV
ncbi:MAG: hypothetical protein AAF253_04105 [Pseudomonadota bacterium]